MSDQEHCAMCAPLKALGLACSFCNGTGEPNTAASAYVKNHICQCINLDRKFCPVCGLRCHHNTPNKPKLLVGGGHE